jgi:hypothetical protein
LISGSFNHAEGVCGHSDPHCRERTTPFPVKVEVWMSALEMGRWAMTTFGRLTTFTAYLSLAFVGAIVLGLL